MLSWYSIPGQTGSSLTGRSTNVVIRMVVLPVGWYYYCQLDGCAVSRMVLMPVGWYYCK